MIFGPFGTAKQRHIEGSVYELASSTKPFTAVAVMMLVEAGKVSLKDRLAKCFSNFDFRV
jgi:CubicO group peptidase (beta-lactamase class C family)